MSETTYSGGSLVKASTLQVGDLIRNPRNKEMIMKVEEAGALIFARGLEKGNTGKHIFLGGDNQVIKVTNATTENSIT